MPELPLPGCAGTSPRAKPVKWNCIATTCSLCYKASSFSSGRFCTRTSFGTEAQGKKQTFQTANDQNGTQPLRTSSPAP